MRADEVGIGQAGGASGADDPDRDFAALAPGRTVGRYEILSILGQGGFGITYRARDDRLHRDLRQPTVSPAPTPAPTSAPTPESPPPPARGSTGGTGLWIGLAALVVIALGGGGAWIATRSPAIDGATVQKADALGKEQAARRQAEEAELAQLRDEKAAREKTAQDLEQRQKIEAELRQKFAAEQEAKARADAEARTRAETEEAARQKALESDRTRATETENAHSITVRVTGKKAVAERTFTPMGGANQGHILTTSLAARFEDGKITGSGSEVPSTERTCTLLLTR